MASEIKCVLIVASSCCAFAVTGAKGSGLFVWSIMVGYTERALFVFLIDAIIAFLIDRYDDCPHPFGRRTQAGVQ